MVHGEPTGARQAARRQLSKSRRAALGVILAALPMATAGAQSELPGLNASGTVMVDGQAAPYLIRHLPVNSFPQLPAAIQQQLTQRGCLIPQTYEAHGPENVVHASLERPGSSDWAVLCSVKGTVSLLVFFGAGAPMVLRSAAETDRLQASGQNGVLGFNWGIDAATPAQVHDAQSDMTPRPPRLDHDALADSVIEQKTVYHYYTKGAWTLVDAGD